MFTANKSSGFTLIELLIVIAIIGIVSSMAMASLSGAQDTARAAKGKNFSASTRSSLMPSMIAEWRLDEASGTVAVDSWGGSNDGTLNGFDFTANSGWKSGAECVLDECLKFDGSNDYINILSDLGDPSEMTIDLWFKKANIDQGSQYLMDARNGGNWWLLQDYVSGNCTDPNGNVCFNARVEIKSTSLANNKWQNVVVVQTASFTKIYLNGELKHSSTGTDPSLGANFRIGTRYTSSGFFNGYIDNVRIYSKALVLSQIKDNYLAGLNHFLAEGAITEQERKNMSAADRSE